MVGTGFTFATSANRNHRLTFKPVELFKSVTKAAIKAAAGSYADAAGELPDIAGAIGLKSNPEDRVGVLILRSLEKALTGLLIEISTDRDDITPNVNAASFLGLSDEVVIEIDRSFFRFHQADATIVMLSGDIKRWLDMLSLSAPDIDNVLKRLPAIFVRSLHDEWRSNPAFYQEIIESIESPFAEAATLEQDWESYRSYLLALCDERVFDETFSLRQIYIEPRCYFDIQVKQGNKGLEFSDKSTLRVPHVKTLNWANIEICTWIENADRDMPIRIIAGGPGSGKSSFAKMLASQLARENRFVLFVPLHQIDLGAGLSRSILEYFRQAGHFRDDPLSVESENPLVLILDGLDEIQMQGRAAQEAAQGFVDELIRYLDRRNTAKCRILCLITGRDLAVQAAEGAFRSEGQIIHLTSYFMSPDERGQFKDASKIYDTDQRDEWWCRYGKLTGIGYENMPEKLRSGEMNDVTSQPLLNYLVALSYRRGLRLDESTNINSVYEDLLKAVHDRAWARHSHPSVKDVPYEAFVRLLEEVALSVWHGAGRTTTLAEVEAHCKQSKVGALLPSFQSGVSSGVSSLLLAFYFRQKDRREDGEKTFEFTHKTFAEYLIGLRVVRLMELVSSQMNLHRGDPDSGLDDQDALARWMSICGRAPLDAYLLDFIRREVAFRGEQRSRELQESLAMLLEAALRIGWPVGRVDKLTFSEQQIYARNAEETLVACVNACARISRHQSEVKWPSKISVGEMIRRLQGQREGPANKPIMSCLSYFKFDDQIMDMIDLYRATVSDCSFAGCQVHYAIFFLADLDRSDLSRARLEGSNFKGTKLNGTLLTPEQVSDLRVYGNRAILVDRDDDEVAETKYDPREKVLERINSLRKRGAIFLDEEGASMSPSKLNKWVMELRFPNDKPRGKVVKAKRVASRRPKPKSAVGD